MIENKTRTNREIWWHILGVVALAALLLPTWTSVGAEETTENSATSSEAAVWTLDLTPAKEIEERLAEPIFVEFENIHLSDLLAFIQDSFEIDIVLDSRVVAPKSLGVRTTTGTLKGNMDGTRFVTDGMVEKLAEKNLPLSSLLTILTESLHLTWELKGRTIWITGKEQAVRDQAVALPSAHFNEGEILDLLHEKIHLEFEDIHIQDVATFLHDGFKLKVKVDSRAVMPAVGFMKKAPPVSPGHTTNGVIGYINLRSSHVGEALFFTTRLLDLTYSVEKDHVFISSPFLVNQPK